MIESIVKKGDHGGKRSIGIWLATPPTRLLPPTYYHPPFPASGYFFAPFLSLDQTYHLEKWG